jgi:hypothetical protein
LKNPDALSALSLSLYVKSGREQTRHQDFSTPLFSPQFGSVAFFAPSVDRPDGFPNPIREEIP